MNMKSYNQLCAAAASIACLLASPNVGYSQLVLGGAVTQTPRPPGLPPGAASVVYRATYTTPGTSQPFFGSSLPYGDEIVLAGTSRVATEFLFAYYSSYDLQGGLSLSFYHNGPGTDSFGHPAPSGVPFFTWDGDIRQSPSGVNVSIPFALDPSSPLPDSFTYVVQFAGESDNNPAGLLLADSAASMGFSFNDLWIDDAWELNVIPGHVANFEASLSAVATAPENTDWTLFAISAFCLIGFKRLVQSVQVRGVSSGLLG